MTDDQTSLDDLINATLNEMATIAKDDEEYATRLGQLASLAKLKRQAAPERVSRDTLAMIVANLLGIVVIVGYERGHVMTSKGLSHIMRVRT